MFDVLLAAFLLLVFLPLLAMAAVLIKLDSEGPVIFVQDRVGRKFVRFRLLKLRTMTINGLGTAYTLGADPRVTRVGRWLRHCKIDELPQLWNVLRGEMSLVGPRPVVPQVAEEFEWAYTRLLAVRPGLTDPATLEYCDENEILNSIEERDRDRYFRTVITPDKIRISLAYIRSRNLWTDLVIVARTALALLAPPFRERIVHRIDPAADPPRLRVLRNPDGIGTGTPQPRGFPVNRRIPPALVLVENPPSKQPVQNGDRVSA